MTHRCFLGCRVPRCDEPGATPCIGGVCDPTHPLANVPTGCRGSLCTSGEACPDGFRCVPELNGCLAIPCGEVGGLACPAGERCDPTVEGLGCVPIRCNEPGGACSAGLVCSPSARTADGCVECVTNDDCGCGHCVGNACFNEPGYCEIGCA